MEFTLLGSDPRFLYLRERLLADGHTLTAENGIILAPPAEKRGVPYWNDPVYIVENAALTAEGAAELVMRRLPGAVLGASILIVGYGRIGSMLADRLALLGASVTVAARRPESRAEARARGHRAVDVTELPADPDAVINTVPAPILSGDFGGALCVELASAPGGWADFTPVLRAHGLPGLYAPRAAADVMADAVYRVMEVDIIE